MLINEVLKPKSLKANFIVTIYRVLCAKFIKNMLEKGGLKSVESYLGLVNDFPKIQEIINDEAIHAEVVKEYRDTL